MKPIYSLPFRLKNSVFPRRNSRRRNPNRNIYDNNGTLWLHCTLHRESDNTKHRVRISLRTHDYVTARRRRDFAMRHISGVVGVAHVVRTKFAAPALQAAA